MRGRTTDELDDLRDEVAGLRADLRHLARRPNGAGRRDEAGNGGLKAGIARHAARVATGVATGVVSDSLANRAHMLREPVERAIARHPFVTGAAALAVTVLLQRYIGLARVARAAAVAAGWRLR